MRRERAARSTQVESRTLELEVTHTLQNMLETDITVARRLDTDVLPSC